MTNHTIDPISFNAGIEAAARWHGEQAELAINSLHCGDSTQTIAAHHRRCQWHRDAAKAIRALHRNPPPHTDKND